MFFYLLPAAILFFLGLAIGSFLNVVIYRAVHGDSPLRGRSYCDHCKHKIEWYDNIPLVSFLILRRKCRYCHDVIPWEYPAVELITGALFVWWYMIGSTFFHLTAQPFILIQPLFWLCVGVLLLVIFFADVSYYLIPDSAVFGLTFISLLYRFILANQHVMTAHDFRMTIISALGASLFFFVLYVGTRGKGMGFGDVKFAFPMGLLLGWPGIIVGLFVAFVSGAIVGVISLALKKKKMGGILPFGPFLVFGTIISLLWGEKIVTMYLSLL